MTMERYYTTLAQSRKLLELGIAPQEADFFPASDVPAWSAQTLQKLMPSVYIEHEGERYEFSPITFYRFSQWHCAFDGIKGEYMYFTGDTLVDALFNAYVGLVEQGFLHRRTP